MYLTQPKFPATGKIYFYLSISEALNPTQAERIKEKIEQEYPGLKVVYAGNNLPKS